MDAHGRMHDMDHDVTGIHQNPIGSLPVFHADDIGTRFLQFVSHVVGQCLDLAIGG